MSDLKQISQILRDCLQLGDVILSEDTALLGDMPEFDSMAVISVIQALQTECAIQIHDDDISGETFATVGSLLAFVKAKQAG
jgi:acyl carrier protein